MYLQDNVQSSYKSLKKLDFVIYSLSMHSLPTITVIELLYALNNILSHPLSALVFTNWQEHQFWIAAILRSSNMVLFWANKRSRFRMPFVHVLVVHMQTHAPFACDACIRGAYGIFVNPWSSGLQLLGVISTKLISSGTTKTVHAWRCGFLFMTHRTCILG